MLSRGSQTLSGSGMQYWQRRLQRSVTAPLAQGQRSQPAAPARDDARIERLKQEAAADVESMKEFTQQMVDSVFSFGELGFQEFETHRYIVDILKKNGFTVTEGI